LANFFSYFPGPFELPVELVVLDSNVSGIGIYYVRIICEYHLKLIFSPLMALPGLFNSIEQKVTFVLAGSLVSTAATCHENDYDEYKNR
jgi:hypothetical protein